MKKIAVCHGKSCGPAGAARILARLKKEYEHKGVQIVMRDCCGRCERSNSIQIDDDVIISDLSLTSLDQRFIHDPDAAIANARKEVDDASKKLDDILKDDLV